MKVHPLKLYLIENKITQKEFAKRCSINPETLSRIINYRLISIPHRKNIDKMHELTGIPKKEFRYFAEEE